MGAHRLYCYAPQRAAVVEFLRDLGSIISHDSPHAVHDPEQLQGLEHINFVMIDGHPHVVPQAMWDVIRVTGACVIHVDHQWERGREARRVPVTHYPPGEPRAGNVETVR